MKLARTIAEVRAAIAELRHPGRSVGLVPTMGALHAGHGALIECARRECGVVAVSVFVNPIQFDRRDDYEKYARDLSVDLEFCDARRVDVVFAPEAAEMYPRPQSTHVEVEGASERLCGEFRPGHFRGVATVVLKLLNIIQPGTAYFGEKDAQQLAVIRRMVANLNVPVNITSVPTVREPDGLALSSRNRQLSPGQRRAAPVLYRALEAAQLKIASGSAHAPEAREAGLAILRAEPLVRVEYFEIVDADEMQPVERITGPVRVAGAIWLGSTRLIDNLFCPASAV